MKNLFLYSIFLLLCASTSCSDSNKSKPNDNNESKTSISGLNSDCQDFLNGYEKYVNDYIAALEKYKSNPTDMTVITDFNRMTAESSAWTSKTPDCSDYPEFITKFSEIQLKLTNAASKIY
jgi:hypothetical protein